MLSGDDRGGGEKSLDVPVDVSSDEASSVDPQMDEEISQNSGVKNEGDNSLTAKKPKKKVEAKEGVKKEKDHLNIIFVGHVG